MLITPQTTKLRWNATIKKTYVDLGYSFTKMGEYFNVQIQDLKKSSSARIKYVCDYCGEIKENSFNHYNTSIETSFTKKDCCKDCLSLKTQETSIQLYGGKSAFSSKETHDKKKETMIARYGVENPMHIPEFIQKQQDTLMENYNVTNPMFSKEIKERVVETNLKKYGYDHPSKNNAVKQKTIDTHLERYGGMGMGSSEIAPKISATIMSLYGVESPLLIEGVTEKRKEALMKMSREPLSKQQTFIHSVSGGDLNYPLGQYLLDIALVDQKIAIEYDGGGHDLSVKLGKVTKEQFKIREKKRENYLKSKGWQTIRIVSNSDKLPNKDELRDIVNDNIKTLQETKYLVSIKLNIEDKEGLNLYKVSI